MPRSRDHLSSISLFLLRVSKCVLPSCVLLCTLSAPSLAQELDPLDEEGEIVLGLPGALPRMNRAQLEEYMYGSLGGSKVAFQKTKRESIRRELDRVHSICGLSELQWSKLNEAIEVDIQHIENRINSLLSGYDSRMTPQILQDMQSKVWQFASTVQSEKLDKNAVWHKVLCSQLTKDQQEKIKADEKTKVANQARTEQLRILLGLQRKLGLNANQRAKIDEWLSQNERSELNFQSICKALGKSTLATEVLREDQVRALEKTSPKPNALRMNPNLILPAIDDLFR